MNFLGSNELPLTLDDTIAELNAMTGPLSCDDVRQRLLETLQKAPDNLFSTRPSADLIAFTLLPEGNNRLPWNTYFSPMSSGTNKDGSPAYFPEVLSLQVEDLSHWERRLEQAVHPILRARYADLLWELGPQIRKGQNITCATAAIDAYLAAGDGRLFSDLFEESEGLTRALQLAIQIDDAGRKSKTITALTDFFLLQISKDGYWHESYRALMGNRKVALSEAEKAPLITAVEAFFRRKTSDTPAFNPHAAEAAGNLLLSYYEAKQSRDDVKRVSALISAAFEKIAAAGASLQAVFWLETAIKFAKRVGDAELVKRLKVARETAVGKSHEEMGVISASIEVPAEKLASSIEAIIRDTWPKTLFSIANVNLYPRSILEKQAAEFARSSVIASTMSVSILSDDHVAAKIDPGADDAEGPLFETMNRNLQTDILWLDRMLQHAVNVHQLTPNEIAAFGMRSKLFPDRVLLREGVTAWMDGDYIKAVFVLVPQIEAAFRQLTRSLGQPVTKDRRGTPGWQVSMNLGDFLALPAIRKKIGEDVSFYFRSLYSDPRGQNLRNTVAHGLIDHNEVGYGTANWVIHSILVIGGIHELSQRGIPVPMSEADAPQSMASK